MSPRQVVSALVLGLLACGKPAEMPPAEAGKGGPVTDRQGSSEVPSLEARPDPCKWLSRDEVQGALGPLGPAAQRVFSVSNPEPAQDGAACLYQLAGSAPQGAGARIVVGVDPTGNMAAEDVGKILNARLAKDAPGMGGVDTASTRDGWDAATWNIDVFHGRVGSLAVEIGTPDWASAKLDRGKVERLAAQVRDKVPDRPFAAPQNSQSPDGDPCSLLTQKDVASVIGRALTSPPFRSSSDGPLVEAGGPSCTYWLGNHRALTLAPQWSDGKQLFKAATMMGNLMDSKLGLTGASADTLDGPWDQVAAAGAGLVFLKGDQMLALSYATAGISLPAAVQLASRALRTLATQH